MTVVKAYWLLLRVGFAVFFVSSAVSELTRLDLFAQIYSAEAGSLRKMFAPFLPARLAAWAAKADWRELVRYSALTELTLAALLLVGPGPAPLVAALRAAKMLLARAPGKEGWECVLAAGALFSASCALWLGRGLPRLARRALRA